MNCGRCIINKHRKLLLPVLPSAAAVAAVTWEHFVDDVRQGRRQEGERGAEGRRWHRALQTQLKRAAATLTVVLHLFQFTVYVCWRSYLQPPFPLPFSPLSLSSTLPAALHLVLCPSVAAQSQFFCLLTAFWGAVARFLCFAFSASCFSNLLATRHCLAGSRGMRVE